MEFKDRLKELRERRGLSQLELAKRVNISNAIISMYEKGTRSPSREMLEALADYFNVDIDYLMGRESGSIYYLDPEAAEIAQELLDRPELKVLFRASRKVNANDLKIVQDMVDRLAGKDNE